MIPKTSQEMQSLLIMALITRLYGDITTEARRKRLTEHDIGTIEQRTMRYLSGGPDFAHEFKDFEAEIPRAAALKIVKEMCDAIRAVRAKQIAQEG